MSRKKYPLQLGQNISNVSLLVESGNDLPGSTAEVIARVGEGRVLMQ